MGRGDWAKRTAGKAVKQLPLSEFKDPPVVRRLKAISLQSDPRIGPLKALIAGDRRAIGRMGATEFAPKIRKRYQTNELGVDSTEFGTRGSEVQILSPRPSLMSVSISSLTDCISVWLRGSKKRESGENTKPSGKRAV